MKQNDDHIHNNNIIDESNANKVMSLDAVTPLQEKKDDETIDTSDSPNISTNNKEKLTKKLSINDKWYKSWTSQKD